MVHEPRVFIIIQARMTSTRLPKKVTLPLCGRTVLEMMFARLSPLKEHLYVATTDDGTEGAIVEICERNSVPFFRGSRDNVLERYYKTARAFGATDDDIIVRLTSDCPLIDPTIVRNVIDMYLHGDYDYVSNSIERFFPRGLDTEVFSFKTLEAAHNNATTTFEREHVTPYIHTVHSDEFSLGSYTTEKDYSHYRLTLDEDDDYTMIRMLYEILGCRTDFTYDELLEVLEAHPTISQINAHVEQKKR